MSRKFLRRTIFFVLIGMLSGCGTTMNMFGMFDEIVPPRYPFGGTIIDVTHALQPNGGYEGMGYVLAMDIPFSIVGDVVALPLTIPHTCMVQYVEYHRNRRGEEPFWNSRSPEAKGELSQDENADRELWNDSLNEEQPQLPAAPAE